MVRMQNLFLLQLLPVDFSGQTTLLLCAYTPVLYIDRYKMYEENVTAKSLVFTKKAFQLLSVLLIAVYTVA